MPAISFNKHIARSRYRDAILADNPILYHRMKFPRSQAVPFATTDETGQWSGTMDAAVGAIIFEADGMIKSDASPSARWKNNGTYAGITIPYNSGLKPKAQLSCEAWIRGPFSTSFSILVQAESGIWPTFHFGFGSAGTAILSIHPANLTARTTVESATLINDDEVHHIVATLDEGTDELLMYVDGVLDATAVFTGSMWASTSPFGVGREPDKTNRIADTFLDEVAMYHYTLSPGQVAHHYDVGKAFYRNYREVIRTAGPVSYWRLGNTVGGNVLDEMKVNDLTSESVILESYNSPMYLEDHNKDRCMTFPGTLDSRIYSASVTGLNNLPTSPNGISIEAWVYPVSFGAAGTSIFVASTMDSNVILESGWFFIIFDNGSGSPILRVMGRGLTNDIWDSTTPVLKFNEWSHVVVNYRFDVSAEFFINGVSSPSVQTVNGNTYQSDTGRPLAIGNWASGTEVDQTFLGQLSDVAIYDRALTAAEAGQHYQEANIHLALEDFYGYEPGSFFPANFNPSWTIEQTNATWTIVDADAYAPIPSKHLQATMNVEGESYITYKDVPPFINGTVQFEFTIATNTSNEQPSILMRYVDANNHIQVRMDDILSGISINDKVGGVNSFTTVAATWTFDTVYYVEVIMNGDQITATAYTDAGRTTVHVTISITTSGVVAGKVGIAAIGAVGRVFHFDNLRADVTDRDEVSQINPNILRDKPIHYWRLGAVLTTDDAVDEIGSFDGTHDDTPTMVQPALTSDLSNTSIKLRGTIVSTLSEGVTVPSLTAPIDMSIECWYKNGGAHESTHGGLLVMYDNNNGFLFTVETANGRVHFDGKTSSGSYLSNVGTTDVDDGKTHHIVVTKKDNIAEIYIDGVKEVKTTSNNFVGSLTSTANEAHIGYHNVGAGDDTLPLNGTVDDMVFYDYALSPSQVLSHYNSSIIDLYYNTIITDTPTYYWRLGESAGPTAFEEISAENLTYVGTPIYGEPGLTADTNTSIDCNGAGYADSGSFGTLTFPFTAEAWVYTPASLPNTSPTIWGTHLHASSYYGIWCTVAGTARQVSVHIGDGGVQSAANRLTWSVVAALPNDATTQIVVVVTNTSTVDIYFDGVLQATTTSGTGSGLSTAGGEIAIGRTIVDAVTADFTIDEVSMWDGVALTHRQILEHFTAGKNTTKIARGIWQLDELTGTVAFNTGLSINEDGDGSYVNAPTLDSIGLKLNSRAVEFDGSTQYVDTSIIMTSPHFTLMCWVNVPHDPNNSENVGPMYQDTRGIIWDHSDAGFRGVGYVQTSVSSFFAASFGTLLANINYHLAVTYDGQNLVSYKDGVAITTTPIVQSAKADTTALRLMETGVTGNRLDGILDDSRVYDIALTADDIASIYNDGVGTYSETILNDEPAHYWQLNELTGTVVVDEVTTNSVDGTYTNTPTLGETPVIGAGTSVAFDQAQIEYATMDALVNPTASFSWECWFRTTEPSNDSMRLMDTRGTGALGGVRGIQISHHLAHTTWENTAIDNGSGQFLQFDNITYNENDGLNHHVVLTFDDTTGKAIFYIDGVEAGTKTNAGLIGANLASTFNLRLAAPVNDTDTQKFLGNLDQVATYDYVLLPRQVINHYLAGQYDYDAIIRAANPEHYWKFDETSGTAAIDEVGGANGIYTNAPTLGAASLIRQGTSVTFNGTNEYMTASGAVAHVDATDFTWECWFKTIDVDFRLMDTRGTGNPGEENGVQISSIDGSWDNTIIDSGDGTNFIKPGSGVSHTGVTNDNIPHHIVLTWDDSVGKGSLYIDGVFKGSDTNANMIGLTFTNSFAFSTSHPANGNNSQWFGGSMDEVAIYHHILSDDTILNHYESGL